MSLQSVIVTDRDQTDLFIPVKFSGNHQVVVMVDNLKIYYFGKKSKTAYLKVRDVEAWHKKEIVETDGKHGGGKFADLLAKALVDFSQQKE